MQGRQQDDGNTKCACKVAAWAAHQLTCWVGEEARGSVGDALSTQVGCMLANEVHVFRLIGSGRPLERVIQQVHLAAATEDSEENSFHILEPGQRVALQP